MLPGTLVAAALAVALVPGYVFLLLIRGLREAQNSTSVEQVIELVTVGVATTGLSTVLALLWWNVPIAKLIKRLHGDGLDAQLLRDLSESTLLIFGAATGIAVILGLIARVARPPSFVASAWKEVFAERRNEYTWLRLELNDGRAIVGPLHVSDFTIDSGDRERDMVLRDPIHEISRTGTPTALTGIHRLVVPEGQIQSIKVVYQPRPPTTFSMSHRIKQGLKRLF